MTNSNFHTKYQLKIQFEKKLKKLNSYITLNIYQVSDKFQLVHNQSFMEE